MVKKIPDAGDETPLMRQYNQMKAVHPDALMLFRMGDFYETFGEDAVKTAKILDITLTKRGNGSASETELAGFPHHALDNYLPRLVRAGERVAICEQLEDPKQTKKLVRRGIVELCTPGIAFSDNVLSNKENNFLAAVCFGKRSTGVAFLDASTGEFLAAEGSADYVAKLLANLAPKEVLYPKGADADFLQQFGSQYYTYRLDEWMFSPTNAREKLLGQLGVKSLKGFGIDGLDHAATAAGAILYYLDLTEHRNTAQITTLSRIDEDKYVWIDRFSIRNLELFAPQAEGGRSFIATIDRTGSPMGARMLHRWISLPLKEVAEIDSRLDGVDFFLKNEAEAEAVREAVGRVGDLERIISRVAVGRVTPREVVQLKNALSAIEQIKLTLQASADQTFASTARRLDPCAEVRERIATHIYPDPPSQIQKGGVIADGVNIELDDLRRIATRGREVLADIQERESARTGIPSLKISFNNVFGYYIEVRNAHRDKVPAEWIRKQTLVGAERYITEELKEYETRILGAEERIVALETQIFGELLAELSTHVATIQSNAAIVARLDVLQSFARLSAGRGYVRPLLSPRRVLDIRDGRHPVIETVLPVGESFVPNSVCLDRETQQIMMITGPNMSGKSALLRQTALIVLMAQIGSHVPAASAEIGIVDKIFTRVGASDNISQGESTFMVEMLESAGILNNLSDRSLILLDEIGRGTSTYDGISIAWAMVEYLHEHPSARPWTMFATHYHELNEMEAQYPRVRNYHVAVKETADTIVFLRKLTPGGTEHSFGIHVAGLAGMPPGVIARAKKILADLEASHASGAIGTRDGLPRAPKAGDMQLSIFQLEDPVLKQIRDEIRDLDIDSLTPLQALNKLSEIKKITGI